MGIGVKYEGNAHLLILAFFHFIHRAVAAFKGMKLVSEYACFYMQYSLFICVHKQLTYRIHASLCVLRIKSVLETNQAFRL